MSIERPIPPADTLGRRHEVGPTREWSLVVRRAPITALLILVAVCVVCACLFLRRPVFLTAIVPLATVITVFFARTRGRVPRG